AFSGKHPHLRRLLLQYPQKITGECDLVDTSVPGRRPLGGRERDSRSATGPLLARNYIVERIAHLRICSNCALKQATSGSGGKSSPWTGKTCGTAAASSLDRMIRGRAISASFRLKGR